MNLLAHAYLSLHDPEILLGNMLGDDVKGIQIKLYPPRVRTGIQLHRYIDSFTDQHPLTTAARNIYRPFIGLYSGAVLDISLDYYLAGDPGMGSQKDWQAFAGWAYQQLEAQQSWHTGGFKRYFPYLKKENWFIHYAERPFIENAMANLLKRAGRSDQTVQVLKSFKQHNTYLETVYRQFFPELLAFVQLKARELEGAGSAG